MTDTTAPNATTQAESLDDKVAPFVEAYEFRHDDGGAYTPNDADRAMLEDAIHGFIADHVPAAAHRRLAAHGAGEGLREALRDLQVREAEYRRKHDLYGDDDRRTGRAWDNMRRSGDRARALLRTPPTDAGSTTREGGEGHADEFMSVSITREGIVTSHNAFDANFDEMVDATRKIIAALQERLANRLKCPFAAGAELRATTPSPDASPDRGEGVLVASVRFSDVVEHHQETGGLRRVGNTFVSSLNVSPDSGSNNV